MQSTSNDHQSSRHLLVTGGAGYVGSTLIPMLLKAGHRVRVLDNLLHGGRALLGVWTHPNFSFVRGDVRNQSDVQSALAGDIHAVVHLAAIVGDPACSRQPDLAKTTNLDGARLVYRLSKEAGLQRFVFASTCSNYGKMKDASGYVTEESELAPVSLYATTKVDVERDLLSDGAADGLATTCLRFATVFGVSPRMRFDLTVNEFTMEMVHNGRLVVFGEQFWRPYIHVQDMARGVLAVLDAPASRVGGQVFNVGSTEQNYQKKTLVDMIRRQAPSAEVQYVEKDEDPRDYRVSFEKIRRQLGFECSKTVEQGIAEVATLVRSGILTDFTESSLRN